MLFHFSQYHNRTFDMDFLNYEVRNSVINLQVTANLVVELLIGSTGYFPWGAA